jgi:hypothetical protein
MALPPPPSETPGWYADPEDSAKRRWWNGVQWTEDFQGSVAKPTPPTASPAALQISEAESLRTSLPDGGSPAAARSFRRTAITRLVGVIATLLIIAITTVVMLFRFGVLSDGNSPTPPNPNAQGSQTTADHAAGTHDAERSIILRVSHAWAPERASSGAWPSTASIKHGLVVSSYGSTDITVPGGYVLAYTATPDRLGYTVTLTDAKGVGMIYQQEYGLFSPTS